MPSLTNTNSKKVFEQLVSGVVAAGTNQATATKLYGAYSFQEVVTAGSGTGVILPICQIPGRITIANFGANDLLVYPPVGGTIDKGTVNAAVTIKASRSAQYSVSSATNYYTVANTDTAIGSTGTVTTASVVSANGFGGTVATATTTPAITITTSVSGIMVGNGTAAAAATAMTIGANNQVNFPEIATPGTLVSGDRWTDATQHCAATFDGSATSANCLISFIPRVIFIQTTPVTITGTGSNLSSSLISTTGAVGLQSMTLPAGFFNVKGRKVRIRGGGYLTTPVSPNSMCFAVKLGTVVVLTSTLVSTATQGNQTNTPVRIDCEFSVKTTGATGTLSGSGEWFSGISSINLVKIHMLTAANEGTESPTFPVVDLTASLLFDLRISMNTVGTSFTLTDLTLEVLG